MTSFERLLNDLDWEEIPNCPGRYRLSRGRVSSHPLALVGADAEAIQGSSDFCRDPFLVVPLVEGGGLLSYVVADGSYVHTLNTAGGLARKLRDLGLSLCGETLRPTQASGGPDPRWDDPKSSVIEFMIRADADPEFDLASSDLQDALRPERRPAELRPGWNTEGHYEIEVDGCVIDFSLEPVGWQVSMLNPPSETWAREVAEEILERISRISGQHGSVQRLQ